MSYLKEEEQRTRKWQETEEENVLLGLDKITLRRSLSTGIYNAIKGDEITKHDVLRAIEKGVENAILKLNESRLK